MTTTLSEATNTSGLAVKCLTFRLGAETYGVSVLKVREIIRLDVDRVPTSQGLETAAKLETHSTTANQGPT